MQLAHIHSIYCTLDLDGMLHHEFEVTFMADFHISCSVNKSALMQNLRQRNAELAGRFAEPLRCMVHLNALLLLLLPPGIELVIVTSWREHLSLPQLVSVLSPLERRRTVGVRDRSGGDEPGIRGQLMEQWVVNHSPCPQTPWFAPDDTRFNYCLPHRPRLVRTDAHGLDEPTVARAVAWCAQQRPQVCTCMPCAPPAQQGA
jgi:hypothetical protein